MGKSFDTIDIVFIVILSTYLVALFLFISIFIIKYFDLDNAKNKKPPTKFDLFIDKIIDKIIGFFKMIISKIASLFKRKKKTSSKKKKKTKKRKTTSKKKKTTNKKKSTNTNNKVKKNYKNNISYVKNNPKKNSK